MSDNPYQVQATPNAPVAAPSAVAMRRISAPAIALIVAGALDILGAFYGFFNYALAAMGVFDDMRAEQRKAIEEVLVDNPLKDSFLWIIDFQDSPYTLIQHFVGFALGAFVIYAGIRIRQLKGYGLGMAAAIKTMTPCLSCCCYGLPIGIWVLVVLMNSDIREAFRARAE